MKINWKIVSGIVFVLFVRDEIVLYAKIKEMEAMRRRLQDFRVQRNYFGTLLDRAEILPNEFDLIVRDFHKE